MKKNKTLSQLSWQEIKIFLIIILVSICGMLGIDLHLASMPSIMQYMHASKTQIQASVPLYVLGMGMSLFFYGPLSDKHGRKPIVIFGLALASTAAFLSIFTQHIDYFLFTRFLQGCGVGVCLGVAKTITADVMQGEKLAMVSSYFSIIPCLSPLFAPAIGGYIQAWFGWQANFLLLALCLLFALLIYTLFCPETNQNKNPQAMKIHSLATNYSSLLKKPLFLGCILLTGIGMGAITAYASLSAVIFEMQLHLSTVLFGWIATMIAIGTIIGKLCGPFFIHRFGSMKTLLMGIYLLLFSGIFIVIMICLHIFAASLTALFIGLTFLGQTFISANANSQALSLTQSKRGSAGALYGGTQMLIAYICSAFINNFTFSALDLLALSYVILGLLGLLGYYTLIASQPIRPIEKLQFFIHQIGKNKPTSEL
ncbi:MAG: MFS transporter [Pseudomonadota bacterium]